MDHCLRVARLCGLDPAAVFEIAGRRKEYGELFEHYSCGAPSIDQLYPDDPAKADLLRRAALAIERSGEEALDRRLSEMERPWIAVAESLQDVASDAGASAAFAEVRIHGRSVILAWRCERHEALAVLERRDTAWECAEAESQGLTLRLCCRQPKKEGLRLMQEAVARNVRFLAPLF